MNEIKLFMREEDGIATIEIVLILLVLIALVIIFRDQIQKLLKSLMKKLSSNSESV